MIYRLKFPSKFASSYTFVYECTSGDSSRYPHMEVIPLSFIFKYFEVSGLLCAVIGLLPVLPFILLRIVCELLQLIIQNLYLRTFPS